MERCLTPLKELQIKDVGLEEDNKQLDCTLLHIEKMVQPVTLKKSHSLKGLTLLPVIRRVMDEQIGNVNELARVAAGKRTEDMVLKDVSKAVEDLTGEAMDELLELAGKDNQDLDAAKLLLHHCILAANERGQPKGQVLQDNGTQAMAGPCTCVATPAEVGSDAVEGDPVQITRRKMDDKERMLEKELWISLPIPSPQPQLMEAFPPCNQCTPDEELGAVCDEIGEDLRMQSKDQAKEDIQIQDNRLQLAIPHIKSIPKPPPPPEGAV